MLLPLICSLLLSLLHIFLLSLFVSALCGGFNQSDEDRNLPFNVSHTCFDIVPLSCIKELLTKPHCSLCFQSFLTFHCACSTLQDVMFERVLFHTNSHRCAFQPSHMTSVLTVWICLLHTVQSRLALRCFNYCTNDITVLWIHRLTVNDCKIVVYNTTGELFREIYCTWDLSICKKMTGLKDFKQMKPLLDPSPFYNLRKKK